MKIPPEGQKDTDFEFPEVRSNDPPTDFSEYMWMENEEEFDKEVMKQLEEEALMEQCIEAMLEDELENKASDPTALVYEFQKLCVQEKNDLAKKSTLNPNAAEFVPRVVPEAKS